jgi:hypothetical protein
MALPSSITQQQYNQLVQNLQKAGKSAAAADAYLKSKNITVQSTAPTQPQTATQPKPQTATQPKPPVQSP